MVSASAIMKLAVCSLQCTCGCSHHLTKHPSCTHALVKDPFRPVGFSGKLLMVHSSMFLLLSVCKPTCRQTEVIHLCALYDMYLRLLQVWEPVCTLFSCEIKCRRQFPATNQYELSIYNFIVSKCRRQFVATSQYAQSMCSLSVSKCRQ